MNIFSFIVSPCSGWAETPSFPAQMLVQKLYDNMPFYFDYLTHSPAFMAELKNPVEQDQMTEIHNYFKTIHRLPELRFSESRADFFLQDTEAERLAKTTEEPNSPIDFNVGLANEKFIELDIPFLMQLLTHEFGHKLGAKGNQTAMDSLATKVAAYFKAYTSSLKVSEQQMFHALSLPINWFQLPHQLPYRIGSRLRPHNLMLVQDLNGKMQDLTDIIIGDVASSAGDLWPAGDTRDKAFTDIQIYFYGWDKASDGKITARSIEQKRLQPDSGPIYSFQNEVYGKTVRHAQQLVIVLEPEQRPVVQGGTAASLDFLSTIHTELVEESPGHYRLILPDMDSKEPLRLRLTTGQGPVILEAEKSDSSSKPLTFLFQIPKIGSNEFIEIHSVVDAAQTQKFLDKFYWFAINKKDSPSKNKKLRSLQMEVNNQFIDLAAGSDIWSRWGATSLKVELPNKNKIRQIRFVWNFTRKHFESYKLRRPFIYNPIEQSHVASHGGFGEEFAYEDVMYEDVVTENELQQDGHLLTVPMYFQPQHITVQETARYMMHSGSFFMSHIALPVTTHHIKGEDLGHRRLVDILVTDENLETTSLMQSMEPLHVSFSASGLSPCEEFMLKRQHYDHSMFKNVKGRRKPWVME